ncbi:Protein CMSS1 [Seminavis robusta]|uniref:Protein CMSS1 n=1 Tax=Seminavis robusta TaxID=568900 RepID=A0A9N8EGH5_9STRA|nr:Protein CMSS1 [Seminavis robusta]|eukprot:Sro910_g219090.1 Protein CMSS1 (293) ;mRNA; r:14608-15486
MGGDDLGSDDEFLTGQVVDDEEDDKFDFAQESKQKKSVLAASTVAVIDDDNDDTKKKRKRDEEESATSGGSKQSKTGNRHKMLVTAGRTLEQETTENQSTFLWTCLVHHHQLKSGQDEETAEKALAPKLQPFHFIPPSTTTPSTTTFEARLRHCLPSMKQVKTWKHRQSPLCIIVCVSARRAVQVLKEIRGLKTRAAKLFAKHLTVEEQTSWLQQTPFAVAVGTPHRLAILAGKNALNLKQTRLVVLDAHTDQKGFTVCTLPDTAPHCMEFVRDWVLPAVKERPKQLKLAFC